MHSSGRHVLPFLAESVHAVCEIVEDSGRGPLPEARALAVLLLHMTHADTHTDTDRHTDAQTHRDTQRHTETHRDTQRHTETRAWL